MASGSVFVYNATSNAKNNNTGVSFSMSTIAFVQVLLTCPMQCTTTRTRLSSTEGQQPTEKTPAGTTGLELVGTEAALGAGFVTPDTAAP
eukprot:13402-Heterococcus_DN1.PRE.1